MAEKKITHVSVQYLNQKGSVGYSYVLPSYLEEEIAIGKMVVVEARNSFALAKIVGLNPDVAGVTYKLKHVIDVIDMKAFLNYLKII
jgi:primosomal protein N'